MIKAPHQKAFSSLSIVIILQSVRSLSLKFFLQTISIVRYKILRLVVEKHHFILIIDPHVNKYIFQANIHQNGPEILGVKRLKPPLYIHLYFAVSLSITRFKYYITLKSKLQIVKLSTQ
jgi:hypothetical protein